MEKTSKELLQLEHKDPSSSSREAALLLFGKGKNSQENKPKLDGRPFTAPLPKSQVLGRVHDFLGVISEANKSLELNAKDKPQEYDIEAVKENESYIELELMLGVADLHTPEAIARAEAAVAGNLPDINLSCDNSYSESDSSEDEDEDEVGDDEDEHMNDSSSTGQEQSKVLENGLSKAKTEGRPKKKRPKIVELP